MSKVKNALLYLMSFQEPIGWLIDKNTESILDVGCGQGLPMELIKLRMNPKHTVGVDLFEPYIREAKAKKIHDKYVLQDIRKLSFKDKSFDTVISLQVLEHLPKKEAFLLLSKLEKIAKKQVIVATPIGYMHHPHVDNNPLQEHKSAFSPEDFEKKGYKTLKFGRKSILGEHAAVHKIQNKHIRRGIYMVNYLLTPLFYFIQPLSNYHVYAYKKINEQR
ncbi:MAG TPA: class I SAM-dependent methyltransferase [Puia sp.]